MSNPKIEALMEELDAYLKASDDIDNLLGDIADKIRILERFNSDDFRAKLQDANRVAHIRPHEAEAIGETRKMTWRYINRASESNGTMAGNIRHVMDKIRESVR